MSTFSLRLVSPGRSGGVICVLLGLLSVEAVCVLCYAAFVIVMPLSQYSAAPVVMLKATDITKLNQIKCVQQVFPSPDRLAIKFR